MSIESAKVFFKRLKTDEWFKKRLGELNNDSERLQTLREDGYDVDEDDLGLLKSKLSDEELAGADREELQWFFATSFPDFS